MPSTKFGKWTVWYENGEEFHRIKREIFSQQIYRMELSTNKPVIIDAGAHIGLSVLWWLSQYPGAKILAIEPDLSNVALLEKNVAENQLKAVTVLQAALDIRGGKSTLYIDKSDNRWFSASSFLSGGWNGQMKTDPIIVSAVTLSQLLNEPIDLLKLDIEGAEERVLYEAGEKLQKVRNLIFEWHPMKGRTPDKLIRWLTKQGYMIECFREGYRVDGRKSQGLLVVEGKKEGIA